MTVEDLWPGSIAPSDLTGAVDLVPSAQSNGRAEDAPPPTAPPRPRDLRSVQRIAAVHATGLLGAPADARLERLVRIAHRSSNASVAVLTIIDGHRQHIVASAGLVHTLRRTYPMDAGVCPYAVAEGDVLVINNLSREARFSSDRLLKDCDAMSCLAVPVRDPAGHRLGALAVMDSRPRRWSAKHTQVLEDLALTTAEVIRSRHQADSLARTRRKLEEVRGLFTRLIDQSKDVFWIRLPYTTEIEFANAAFAEVYVGRSEICERTAVVFWSSFILRIAIDLPPRLRGR